MKSIKNILIIGTGLMGGSLAKSLTNLKNANRDFYIAGICKDRRELIKISKRNIFDYITSEFERQAIKDADLIVVCTPVAIISSIINKIAGFVNNECIITDVGSVKESIYTGIKKKYRKLYLGSHPMCGSEKSGIENLDETLYENAVVMLTPWSAADNQKCARLREFWSLLKCQVKIVDIKLHDLIAANISHLPHLTAAALVNTVPVSGDTDFLAFAGGGFRDATRIAAGNPDLWTDICFLNKSNISKTIDVLIANLKRLKKIIAADRKELLNSYLKTAAEIRNTIPTRIKTMAGFSFDINIKVKDEPGALGRISVILGKNEINIKNIEVLYVREGDPGAIKIGFDAADPRDKAYRILKSLHYQVYKK